MFSYEVDFPSHALKPGSITDNTDIGRHGTVIEIAVDVHIWFPTSIFGLHASLMPEYYVMLSCGDWLTRPQMSICPDVMASNTMIIRVLYETYFRSMLQ